VNAPESGAGRVAVVTGAGRGIGRAIAMRLAKGGDVVAVVDIQRDAAEQAVRDIETAGGRAVALVADLSEVEAPKQVIDQIHMLVGPVKVLVNNVADHGERVGFGEVTRSTWDRILATNVAAAAFLAQAVAADMAAAGGGVIVNLLAIQEHLPAPTYVPYVTSKGALAALTRALAVELAPMSIRVCGVAPGMVSSDSTEAALAAAGGSADAGVGAQAQVAPPAPTLVGRMGSPDDIAGAVAFLASPEAAYITGASLRVDGGRILSRHPDPLATLENRVGSSAGPERGS